MKNMGKFVVERTKKKRESKLKGEEDIHSFISRDFVDTFAVTGPQSPKATPPHKLPQIRVPKSKNISPPPFS